MKFISYKHNLLRLIAVSIILTATSCNISSSRKEVIPHTDKANVQKAGEDVMAATSFAFTAQQSVSNAQAEIIKAKIYAKEIESLVATMKRKKSEFTDNIETLRQIYVQHITVIEKELRATSSTIKKQIIALKEAEKELEKAKVQIANGEKEKAALRESNAILAKDLEKYQAYKDKYHKLTKYKWIVWGLGAWILVKFLGGLGAWSPQGRIARALIG
jgi:hypothetical protein